MLSLSLFNKILDDEDFVNRAVAAFNIVAHEVLAESPNTDNHILRVNHANMIIQQNPEYTKQYVSGIIGTSAIQETSAKTAAEIPDDKIILAVHQVWNNLIGIGV